MADDGLDFLSIKEEKNSLIKQHSNDLETIVSEIMENMSGRKKDFMTSMRGYREMRMSGQSGAIRPRMRSKWRLFGG